MSAAPLEVKVIYSASSRGRRKKGRVVRSRPSVRGASLLILGILNAAAAGGLYYWTCWDVDREIYLKLMLYTPFSIPSAGPAPSAAPANAAAPADEARQDGAAVDSERFQGRTAQTVIGATAYGWLTLALLAAGLLSMSSGSCLGRWVGSRWRGIGILLAMAALAGLGWTAYKTWADHGIEYPPSHWRMWMGGVVLTALFLGWAMIRRVRRWTLIASLAVLLSACGSVVALYLGNQCGAVEASQVTPKFLGTVFAAQSGWGWVLLIVGWRMSR